MDPDAPEVGSFIENAYFDFGLSESEVSKPAYTIFATERRSESAADVAPYCSDIYHPWFTAQNVDAPEDEMDPAIGAIATTRHLGVSNYEFSDGHVKALPWGQTYAPPTFNLHSIRQ